jgi:hypothetical protein
VKVDRTKVTGKKGAPFVGADTQMVTTAPFSAAIAIMPGATAGAADQIVIAFTNAVAATIADHVKVTAAGVPVTAQVTPDTADPRMVNVVATQLPPGYVVTVDKDAADLFGVKLGMDVSSSAPSGDGGVADGGSPQDGGPATDAGVPEDGGVAPDAAAAADAATADDATAADAAAATADATVAD